MISAADSSGPVSDIVDEQNGEGRLRRATRQLILSPALYYAALALLVFPIFEILRNGENAVQYIHDVFDGDLPVLAALASDWRHYGISLWDPHLTSGNAALAQSALPPFTPDFLLSFAMPLFAAYTVTYVAIIWVAGYGMHLFLRDSMRVSSAACRLGGTLYAFSFWHYIHGFSIPMLPVTLWLTDRWARAGAGRWKLTVALILLGAFGLYAGLIQLEIVVAAVQGAYLLVTRWRSGHVLSLLGQYVVVWVGSLLLFAPVMLTQAAYLSSSQRAVWDLAYLYDSALVPAIRDAVSLFGSALAGIPIDGLTAGSAEYSGTYFVGGLSLLLLLVGLVAAPRDARTRFMAILIVAVPILYLVALLVTPLQAQVGFLRSFQFVRVSHLLPFALVVNAAVGADLLLSGTWRARPMGRAVALLLAGLVIVLAAQAAFAAWQAISLGFAPDPDQRAIRGWLYASVAIGTGVVSGCLLVWYMRRQAAGLAASALVVVLILGAVVVERALFTRSERYLHAGLGTYASAMDVDPALAYIAAQPNADVQRTLAAGTDSNRMLLAGLFEVGGYQSIYPLVAHSLFGALTDPYLRTDAEKWRYFHDWGNRADVFGPGLDGELLDLMGVRWIYARNMSFADPQLEARFRAGNVTVYENTDALPRAFVVHAARSFPTEPALLTGLMQADDAALRTTAFGVAGDLPADLPVDGAADAADARIIHYEPDRVEVETTTRSPGLLILTDTFAPGWTASVNGRTVQILPVDVAYRAVSIPPGTSRVEFVYRPWFTYAGVLLAGSTAILLIAWALIVRRRDRGRVDRMERGDGAQTVA